MPRVSLAEAEAPLVLALDMGTSSLRALLFDRRGRPVDGTEAQRPYDLRTTPDGGAEADAAPLFELLLGCIDGALQAAGGRVAEIGAVGSSCFWHSLLGLDERGTAVTPIYYWADTRSVRQVDELRREIDVATMHARTGCPLHSSFWPAKLRWLRATAPATFGQVARWCSFGEYVMRRLHGEAAAGVSIAMASGTGMLDVRRLESDAEMLAVTGVDREQLAPLIDRDTPATSIGREYAARWPALAEVPWFPSLGDGACANVGGGAIGPDRLALTLGTSGAMRMVTPIVDLPLPDRLWMYRLDRAHGILGGALSSGGNVPAWLRRLLGIEVAADAWREAGELAPDAHGLTMLPFIAGERAPSWNAHAHGVVAGLTLATGPKELLRAGMEAVAYRFALIYEALAPFAAAGHEIVAGGAAILNSPAWLQIIVDVLDHDVLAPPPDEEASARGAAIAALVAIGVLTDLSAAPDPVDGAVVYRPDRDRHERYRAGLARHVRLEGLLFPDGGAWV
ncbi:MAG: gluconokinase [Thermomicrobiales bacterium]|nr:gluconokinase [Thermomicrobiales bacterium]